MTLSNKLYPAAYALWLALLLRVAWKINQEVHEPYMVSTDLAALLRAFGR